MMAQSKTNRDVQAHQNKIRAATNRHGKLQYVDVNDMARLLKMGVALHGSIGVDGGRSATSDAGIQVGLDGRIDAGFTAGTNSFCKLAGGDAWVAAVLTSRDNGSCTISKFLAGPHDNALTRAAATEIRHALQQRDGEVRRLVSLIRLPDRVNATISANANVLFSALQHVADTPLQPQMTWISLHRSSGAPPFTERERRLVGVVSLADGMVHEHAERFASHLHAS